MRRVNVAIVGAGAAGLSLAHRSDRGLVGRSVALVETAESALRPPERTWCFWEPATGEWDAAVSHRWHALSVFGPDGTEWRSPTDPLVYKMVRSRDFEALVRGGLSRTRPVEGTVLDVADGADGALVRLRGADGEPEELAADAVFDSRPPRGFPADAVTLWQHFRGWFVRTERPCFDTSAAVLMDMRVPRIRRGVAFGYVLPFSAHEALVEYTEFSPTILDDAGYDAALRDYTGRVLGLGEFAVTATEQGAIPMTTAPLPVRVGRRVFRIGTAGGATRPSTGYTFTGVQRQTRQIAAALAAGRVPGPSRAHRARHLFMDAVLLRGLDEGVLDGAEFFAALFRGNPLPRLLDFLDGSTTPLQDVAIGATTPIGPMLSSVRAHAAAFHRRGFLAK